MSAMDLAIQAAPDHPCVRSASRVVPPRAGRHHQVRREPAQEIPGHLPDRLPRRRLARRASALWLEWKAMLRGLDRARREDLPRRQPAHQADPVLAMADRRGAARPSGRRSSCPRRSPRPKMMRQLAKVGLHPELHLLHLARVARRAARLPDRADPERDARVLPRQPVRRTRPTSTRITSTTAGRAFVIRSVLAATLSQPLRHLLGLGALRDGAPRRARGVPGQREVRDPRARLGRAREHQAAARPSSTACGTSGRRCSATRTCASRA